MTDSVKVSNSYLSSNPDYSVEVEEQTGNKLRQVVKVAEIPNISVSPQVTATANEINLNVTTTSQEVLASNTNRKAAWLINLSDTTIYVSFGATATALKIPVFQYGTLPISINGVNYTGAVNAVHTSTGDKGILIQWC